VAAVLAALAHKSASSVSVENVGPTWNDITHKAVEALIVFLIVISAYISIFFEWKIGGRRDRRGRSRHPHHCGLYSCCHSSSRRTPSWRS